MATGAPEHDIERLVQQIEATRAGLRRYRRALGVLATALAAGGLAGLLAGADFLWELGLLPRAVGLAGTLAAVALLAARIIARPGRELGRIDAAGETEDGFPALGQRVRTTLEYAEPTPATAPAAPGLVTALHVDTDRRTRPLELPAVVPWRTLRAPAGALGLAVAAVVVLLVREPEARIALARVFLLPAAYTWLDVKPGDQTLKAGAEFSLEARITGRAVRHAEWRRRPARSARAWTTVSLAPPDGERDGTMPAIRGTLHDSIKDCRETFEYQVIAGAVVSPTYRVKVLRPLVIEAIEADVEPPAYTRRSPTTEKSGDFQVIAGSAVRIYIVLDRVPRTAQVVLTDPDDRQYNALTYPISIQDNVIELSIPHVDHSINYTATASAGDGMSLEPHTYKIRVQPDENPAIQFLRPAEDLAVIATAEVPIEVEATDDFGVGKVGINWRRHWRPRNANRARPAPRVRQRWPSQRRRSPTGSSGSPPTPPRRTAS